MRVPLGRRRSREPLEHRLGPGPNREALHRLPRGRGRDLPEYQDRKKRDIGRTLRRHFLNDNPDNPFEASDPNRYEARSPYGPLPDPVHWFNVESIFMGAAAAGWSGAFVPIPLDSVLALFSKGGTGEFADSMTGDWEPITNRPPSVKSFRVKHR